MEQLTDKDVGALEDLKSNQQGCAIRKADSIFHCIK